MGELVNSTLVKRTGWAIVVVVVALNLWLLVGTALGLKEKGAGRLLFD
jgi:manganese transport protein